MAVVIWVASSIGGRTPDPSVQVEPPPQPSSESPSSTTDPRPSPEPTVAETPDEVRVFLAFQGRVWIQPLVDGLPLGSENVAAGETREFVGSETVEIRFGNLGGVDIELNGKPLGSLGGDGEVRTIRFGRSGIVNDDVEGDADPAEAESPTNQSA
jgi:hypothetical protein